MKSRVQKSKQPLSRGFILVMLLLLPTTAYALLVSGEEVGPAWTMTYYRPAPVLPDQHDWTRPSVDRPSPSALSLPSPTPPADNDEIAIAPPETQEEILHPSRKRQYAGEGRFVRAWSVPTDIPSPARSNPARMEAEPGPAPLAIGKATAPPLRRERPSANAASFRSVRFDAGYYYGKAASVEALAKTLVDSWEEKGINVIYFYAYNRVFGARYRTSFQHNIMEDFGRQDLLGKLLPAAHARGMKVIAWLYGIQHKQAWEANPSWREKQRDGSDYRPASDIYPLCARNSELRVWWRGFIKDLLDNYPQLDGIDMAEAQVDLWGDNACYCESCRASFAREFPGRATPGPEWRRHRASALTELLLETNRLAHEAGAEAHVTSTFTADRKGRLLPGAVVRDVTGFDLEALLGAGRDRPDVVQAQLIWQQWAASYQDSQTFSPGWTERAVQEAARLVRGRAKLVAHIELTDFGGGAMDGARLQQTVQAALAGKAWGVDIYDANLLDRISDSTRNLRLAWLPLANP